MHSNAFCFENMDSSRALLVDFIRRTSEVPEPVAKGIAANFEPVEVRKNDIILKEGKVCDQYIFLDSGFARAYTFDAEGNEVTTNFFGPQAVAFEVSSFFRRTPSKENIQALTDCNGWYVNYETLNNLFHGMPEFREFGRTVLVNGFVALKERMLSMINHTAEQRYELLLQSKPEIFQNASLKHIASYLGIADTSLSRIRKELARK